jgi:hypothetical protein
MVGGTLWRMSALVPVSLSGTTLRYGIESAPRPAAGIR